MEQPACDLQQSTLAATARSNDGRDLSRREPARNAIKCEDRRTGARGKRQTDGLEFKRCRRRTWAHAHPNGLLFLSRALASVASERSNSLSLSTAAFTSFMLSFQNLPCAMHDSTFGTPSSEYQVQRGAAASISAGGTLVASAMILTTPASLAAAALLNSRA